MGEKVEISSLFFIYMTQREILKKHCWWRDLKWLKKRINKRLVNNGVDILIEQLIPILNNVYGDNWDIQFEFINPSKDYEEYGLNEDNPRHNYDGLVPYKMNIIIHYPEIEITNSRNNSHIIKDLYVAIPISICNLRNNESEGSYNKPFIHGLQGCRFTCNQLEYLTGYLHSHLSVKTKYINCENFNDFCTGEGDMSLLIGQLNELLFEIPTRSQNLKLDLNLFELYFRHINTYIRWESLEGGPYIQISTINNISIFRPAYNNKNHDLKFIFNFFKNEIKNRDLKFNFTIENNLINVVIDDNFYEIVYNVLNVQLTILKKVYFENTEDAWTLSSEYTKHYFKDSSDTFYKADIDLSFMNIDVNQYQHYFPNKSYFRNEEIKFKLEKANLAELQSKTYLHPNIYVYIKEQLTNYLNEQQFKQKYFSRQS